ncbi:MAG TPA: HEAT repeat domain-containing protein [Crinalium sp.]
MTDTPSLQTLIDAIEQADSPERLIAAVQALAAARLEDGIPTLIKALGYNNPGAAMVAVRGLVQMGEVAVLPLLNLMDDYNYGARAYAIRALAAIADPRALDVLLVTAETDFAPSVRRAATKGLGLLRWFQLPSDQVAIAQDKVLKSLFTIAQDEDWSLRYSAIVGLQALASAAQSLHSTITARLQQIVDTETDLAVRSRALWAIATLGDQSNPGDPLRVPCSSTTAS